MRVPNPDLTVTTVIGVEIKGDRNITNGKMKQRWAKLKDDELKYSAGKQEELVGQIHTRTVKTRKRSKRRSRNPAPPAVAMSDVGAEGRIRSSRARATNHNYDIRFLPDPKRHEKPSL